jgi:prenyltransferase beta subunit
MATTSNDAAPLVNFLRGLGRESGGFANTYDGEAALRPTLSVLKALEHLGRLGAEPRTVEFIGNCRHDSGGFAGNPGAQPSPLDTTAGLIALHTLRQDELLQRLLPDALAYLKAQSSTRFDHFMLIATYE